MATQQGLMSAEVTDRYGITATTTAFITIDDTKTIAQLLTDVNDWATDLNPLTAGNITKVNVRIEGTALGTGAGAGQIEKGGLFNFDNASDPYATGYWVPDIADGVLDANGLIDLTNTDVTTFITFMTTAHTVITVVTKGVRALSALRDALLSFRKHRKPLERKTKEVA